MNVNTLCQNYLNIIYHDIKRNRAQNNYKKNNLTETYGEILYPSMNKLLSIISPKEEDIFLDLGSGNGKVVIQTFLKSAVKEARGMEIIHELHEQATAAASRVQQDLPEFYADGRKLIFLLTDFLTTSITGATILFINSTCFSQKILVPLGKIINNTPTIHSVLTTRPICTLQRLPFKKSIRIECSWDSALCYIYSLK